MKILVTGGCGFIGSNFIHLLLEEYRDIEIINLDALTYAGNLANLQIWERDPRYRFVRGDIADPALVNELAPSVDAVINFAAESHVDRSIESPLTFAHTNILGTMVLLNAARQNKTRFLQVSTDEVYGSLGPTGVFTEESPLAPNSPYAASKTSADLFARAYGHTYGLPVIITRCSNNYGPYQFPEKLIPLMIANALNDRPLPVYGDGLNVRDWIYVGDHCRALDLVLRKGTPGELYNIGASHEVTNLEIVKTLLGRLNKPESLIRFVADRPGHDRRYAIDSSKLQKELGWRPREQFADGLAQTIAWYLDNRDWWEKIQSGAYRDYYENMYGKRLREADK